MTYSIVARDPDSGELGVAVQSALLGAGRIVPWAEAGIGAVATQAMVEIAHGPELLERLRGGQSAADALHAAMADDPGAAVRQVAVVGAAGRPAVHTGDDTIPEQGEMAGESFSVQANMMAEPGVPEAMAGAYLGAEGDLANRMLSALDAAQTAGGDFRGQQAAGLIVVEASPVDRPANGVVIDVRVDDHPAPLTELRRLTDLARDFHSLLGTFDLIESGDVDAALSAFEAVEPRLAAVAETGVVGVWAHLANGDEAGARDAVARFAGDRAVVRRYLGVLPPPAIEHDPGLLDRLFD
jgi:uncharacterized Ntn-hydrolase superfamily protein